MSNSNGSLGNGEVTLRNFYVRSKLPHNTKYQAALSDTPKPCPWCGDDPYAAHETGGAYYICCTSHFCGVRPYVCKPSRSGALMAWNQRAGNV